MLFCNFFSLTRYSISQKHSKDWSINAHMYFTTRDSTASYDALGKGYNGGACNPTDLGQHAVIMEYQYDDITFSRVSHFFKTRTCD